MKVRIFADGACSGNPGPGGWACILEPEIGQPIKTYRSGKSEVEMTTNNKMEITAVTQAMAMILDYNWDAYDDFVMKFGDIEIFEKFKDVMFITDAVILSDSSYVINVANGLWKGKENKKEWLDFEFFRNALKKQKTHSVSLTFEWVKGHNKNILNEFADDLAKAAIKGNPISTI